jgi:murein DD-endopeptidase MepM/ murein hydrolase activator NlpD
VQLKSGVVAGGLSVSLSQAGVPDAVALTLVRELSQAFNVDEDVSANDRFAVLFETALPGSAAGSAAQKLLAFEYTHQGKTYAAYWFDVSDAAGDEGYFLADGSSLRPAFLRTPIELVRVTSGFGARKVPKRKKWRNHDGIDFGAPSGTRIFAAADGVIEVMRMERGFGKVVKLAHPKNAMTIYGHMSAFVQGLKVGDAVKQGDVIGFVGRTGWATGPHLHYEYRVDNKPIDPFSNDFPTSQRVPEARMPAFNEWVQLQQAKFGLLKRAAAGKSAQVAE